MENAFVPQVKTIENTVDPFKNIFFAAENKIKVLKTAGKVF